MTKTEAAASSDCGPIRIVFRFDDISGSGGQRYTEFEERILQSFKCRRIPCVFAVIPFVGSGHHQDHHPQDPIALPQSKADMLRSYIDCGILEVALHGYHHRNFFPFNGASSEFQGMPEAEQRRRIREGRAFLAGRVGDKVVSFVPPWNRCDATTKKIVEEESFLCFSSGQQESMPPNSQVLTLSCNTTPETLKRDFLRARPSGKRTTLVLLSHPYEFKEVGKHSRYSYTWFFNLVDWVRRSPA